MKLPISYFLEVLSIFLLLYLFYFVVLRKQHIFSFNRLYLLLTPLAALFIPLIEWPTLLPVSDSLKVTIQSVQIDEIAITGYGRETSLFKAILTPINIALGAYFIGALLILFKLIWQIQQVYKIKANSKTYSSSFTDVNVYQVPDYYPTFAFGKSIYLSATKNLNPSDQEQILTHELAHIKFYHTWDVIYFELISAIMWVNPFIWLFKQELRDIHEYQADAVVLKNFTPKEYSALLSKSVLHQIGLPVGSYFKKPQVLKRLYMLQNNGEKTGWLRPALLVPLFGALIYVFSSKDIEAQSIFRDLNNQEHTDFTPTNSYEESSLNFVNNPKPKPFTYVEQMPQFKGGDAELIKYLSSNIHYPEADKKAGMEGLVVVNFIIEEDGSLSSIRVLRSVSETIDTEALRLVKSMNGMWTAGMQNGATVRVEYTIPIRFAL
jgi:TonB family protein